MQVCSIVHPPSLLHPTHFLRTVVECYVSSLYPMHHPWALCIVVGSGWGLHPVMFQSPPLCSNPRRCVLTCPPPAHLASPPPSRVACHPPAHLAPPCHLARLPCRLARCRFTCCCHRLAHSPPCCLTRSPPCCLTRSPPCRLTCSPGRLTCPPPACLTTPPPPPPCLLSPLPPSHVTSLPPAHISPRPPPRLAPPCCLTLPPSHFLIIIPFLFFVVSLLRVIALAFHPGGRVRGISGG